MQVHVVAEVCDWVKLSQGEVSQAEVQGNREWSVHRKTPHRFQQSKHFFNTPSHSTSPPPTSIPHPQHPGSDNSAASHQSQDQSATTTVRDCAFKREITSTYDSTMAEGQQIPTFKLVLVGDGGTGKVSEPDIAFHPISTARTGLLWHDNQR